MASSVPPNITYQSLLQQNAAQPMTAGAEQQAVAPLMAMAAAQQQQPTGVPSEQERLNTFAFGTPQGPGAMAAPVQATIPQEAQAQNKINWKTFLSDPRVKIGFLQMGMNLLAGQNMGAAIGGGLAATGRAYGMQKAQEDAARARVAGSRSAGSRGGSSRQPAKLDYSFKDINKMIDDYVEASTPLGETPRVMTPGERQRIYDTMLEVKGAGGDPMQWLDVALTQGTDVAVSMHQAIMTGGAEGAGQANNQAAGATTPTSAADASTSNKDEELSFWDRMKNIF